MLAVIPLVSLTDRRPARQLYLASSVLNALSCDEAGNDGKSKHGDAGQHRGEAEQPAGYRREHED